MRALLLAALLVLVAPARREGRGRGDDRVAGPAGRRRAHDGAARRRRPSSTWSASTGRAPAGCSSAPTAVAGRWSSWRPVAPEAEDLPDPGSRETRIRSGLAARQPVLGRRRPTASAYRAGGRRAPAARLVRLEPGRAGAAPDDVSMTGSPQIVPRRAWGANEEITRGAAAVRARGLVRGRPPHGRLERLHPAASPPRSCAGSSCTTSAETAGTTSATTSSSTSTARSSRAVPAGSTRNVIGAHAEGFNTGSIGVAVIGNYSATRISAAALHALVGLLAWRLDVAHVDPLSTLTWRSGGNPKYRAGKAVKLRAISGHRDTGLHQLPRRRPLLEAARHRAGGRARPGCRSCTRPQVVGGLGGLDQVHRQALRRRRAGR